MKNTKTFNYKYKFCLLKGYFDKGYSLTSPVKYLILLFGVTAQDLTSAFITAVVYGFSCFFIGWAWYKSNFIRAEQEVNNRFNYFVQEMREAIEESGAKKVLVSI